MKRWMMAMTVAVAACGGSAGSGATCPTNNTLTYDNFGRTFMARYCDRCHAMGTSPTINNLASIQRQRSSIDAEAAAGPNGTNTGMPEGGTRPTDAERTQLGQWLACGAL